jgi:phytoene dehydrogenase-like protein
MNTLIIGAGHNGLVCAYYLAKAGLNVTIAERRGVVGGAAVTEEFHPGFRNSVASYTVSLLHAQVIADMRLAERGLQIVERPISNFLPTADGGYLKLGGGLERTQAEVAKFSERDAERLPAYYAMLDDVGDVLRGLATQTPPNQPDGLWGLPRAITQGNLLRRLDIVRQRNLLDLFTKSARDFLDAWFESDPIKAALGFDSIVGNYASPDTPGSAYVLLHHTFGGVNGKKGNWGHAMGGMGAITQKMAEACREAGVRILRDSPVAEVLTHSGRVRGARLADGTILEAGIVVSNLNPKLLFNKLIDPAVLDADFRARMANYKCGSGTFRMNVALSELPDFSCLSGSAHAEHHESGIVIAPTLDYMDRAYQDARAFGWSREPIVEILIPSTVDPSLAPPGQHVASLFCQQVAPVLPGRDWASAREEVADLMIATVNRHAPNFAASVLGRVSLSPADLEEKFGLVGGDIMHGHMSLDQLWAARPVLGNASYRAPVAGLYMCGAGTHPGGGVSGMPGMNAAREVLADRSVLRRVLFFKKEPKNVDQRCRGPQNKHPTGIKSSLVLFFKKELTSLRRHGPAPRLPSPHPRAIRAPHLGRHLAVHLYDGRRNRRRLVVRLHRAGGRRAAHVHPCRRAAAGGTRLPLRAAPCGRSAVQLRHRQVR